GIVNATEMPFGEAPSRARRVVKRGDVIVSTVRTYLRAVAQVDREHDGAVVSTGFAVLRPRQIDQRYLRYAVLDGGFLDRSSPAPPESVTPPSPRRTSSASESPSHPRRCS